MNHTNVKKTHGGGERKRAMPAITATVNIYSLQIATADNTVVVIVNRTYNKKNIQLMTEIR